MAMTKAEIQKRYQLKHAEKIKQKSAEKRKLHPEKHRSSAARWRKANPGKERDKHYRRKFGINLEDYQRMYEVQEGLCAICRKPEIIHSKGGPAPMWLSVDHDHKTGRVRGLLCFKCNTALSYFEKNGESMTAIILYLERKK